MSLGTRKRGAKLCSLSGVRRCRGRQSGKRTERGERGLIEGREIGEGEKEREGEEERIVLPAGVFAFDVPLNMPTAGRISFTTCLMPYFRISMSI